MERIPRPRDRSSCVSLGVVTRDCRFWRDSTAINCADLNVFMKAIRASCKMATLVVALSVPCLGSVPTHCDPNGGVTAAEMREHGLLAFSGILTALDTRAGALAIEVKDIKGPSRVVPGQHTVYVTGKTIICNRGKPGGLGDAKIGDEIGGLATRNNGKFVALIVGIGRANEIHPYAIPVPGKTYLVESPFARGNYINIKGHKTGDELRDPYTHKLFLVP